MTVTHVLKSKRDMFCTALYIDDVAHEKEAIPP